MVERFVDLRLVELRVLVIGVVELRVLVVRVLDLCVLVVGVVELRVLEFRLVDELRLGARPVPRPLVRSGALEDGAQFVL